MPTTLLPKDELLSQLKELAHYAPPDAEFGVPWNMFVDYVNWLKPGRPRSFADSPERLAAPIRLDDGTRWIYPVIK